MTLALADNKTCTITNDDIAPTLTVIKDIIGTPPDGGLFNLQIDGTDHATDVGDGGTTGAVPVSAGSHDVGETAGTGSDLDNYVTTIGGDCAEDGSITLDLDEDATCTITNTAKGMAQVIKTESGTPTAGFTFEIREGASESDAGTVIANGTTDANGFTDFGGFKLVPGTYQFCETGMLPGWSNSFDGFTPLGATPEGGDNSTECINFEVDPGEIEEFTVNNTPPPGGDARTIGFWKNWSECSGGNQDPVLDETLASFEGSGVFIGDLFVDNCDDAKNILNKSDLNGKKLANDAAYNLAAQLLAAQLNIQADAGSCAEANQAISDAQALLESINFNGTGGYLGPKVKGALKAQAESANSLAATLDDYNNNLLCS